MTERSTVSGSTEGMKEGGYYDAHSEYQRRVVEGGDALIRSVVRASIPARSMARS